MDVRDFSGPHVPITAIIITSIRSQLTAYLISIHLSKNYTSMVQSRDEEMSFGNNFS